MGESCESVKKLVLHRSTQKEHMQFINAPSNVSEWQIFWYTFTTQSSTKNIALTDGKI